MPFILNKELLIMFIMSINLMFYSVYLLNWVGCRACALVLMFFSVHLTEIPVSPDLRKADRISQYLAREFPLSYHSMDSKTRKDTVMLTL